MVEMLMGAASGLTNGKLALANADTSDVLNGMQFYAGDKLLKTGTLLLDGDAEAGNVLADKTFYNTDAKSKVTGTMANNGAWTKSISPGGSVTIPAGYHNGGGKVTAGGTSVSYLGENVCSTSQGTTSSKLSGYSKYLLIYGGFYPNLIRTSISAGSLSGRGAADHGWGSFIQYEFLTAPSSGTSITVSFTFGHNAGGPFVMFFGVK